MKRKSGDDSKTILAKFLKIERGNSDAISNDGRPVEKLKLPQVVHLRRVKGKITQDCDVYIGRACQMGGWNLCESKWHNPYSIKQFGRDEALSRYRIYIESNTNNLLNELHELAGKRLGCWCKPNRCHGDILRELFQRQINQPTTFVDDNVS